MNSRDQGLPDPTPFQDAALSHSAILLNLVLRDGVEPPEFYEQQIYSLPRYPYGLSQQILFKVASVGGH